ncbi:MAG: hypothetical protein AAFZ52_01150 [Bacteroidota bacterium]
MILRLLFPLILTFLFTCGRAQQTAFAYASNTSADRFAPRPVTNYKYAVVQSVYDKLVRAHGDRRQAKLKLVMNQGNQYVAWLNPVAREIGLEERAYDVCTQFGADSLKVLANLLAHELIHYYENHDWARHFVNQNEGLAASEQIAAQDEGVKQETQADYLGGILAISAGYDAYHLMPEFLRKVYAAYRLPEQIPGYPSLTERIAIGKNTARELKKIHTAYQTANLLTLVDGYTAALNYYDFVLAQFQSYEVYNNAGVCAALAVLDLLRPEEMPFALPLELDPSSRLDELATRLPDDLAARKEALLSRAQNFLENAVNLTDEAAAPRLNLAVLSLLAGELGDADYLAGKALRTARKMGVQKTEGDALIVQGVAAALAGNQDAARGLFQRAQTLSPALAGQNLRLLDGGKATAKPAITTSPPESIGQLSLDDFLEAPELDLQLEITPEVFCGRRSYSHSELLMHYADFGEAYAIFQTTSPWHEGTSGKGLRPGATRAAVKKQYGTPDKVLALTNGTALRYAQAQALFFFDRTDKLVHWTVFRVQL